MGNCCKPASSMEWCGEDWSSLTSENTTRKTMSSSSKMFDEGHGHELSLGKVQKEKLLETLKASSSPDHANGTVKIKISKKELRELLGGKEKQVKRASAEEVLFRLTKARDHDARHGLWRPVLETIPEVS